MQADGRDANSPWQMPAAAWKAIAKRTWAETSEDNIGLIASGVAFYGFLALVPLLGALVLSYGLIADPATVLHNVRTLTAVMPADAAKVVGEQLMNVVKTSDGKKGLGLLLALGLALFGARNGAGAIITALNIAFEEKEKRGFVRVNLLALAITGAAVGIAILAMVAITALGHVQTFLPTLPPAVLLIGKIGTYVLLTIVGAAGAATLYRFGPSREHPRWIWLTPGSLFAAVCWLILTVGFGIYAANFGNYNATYGSLGAVVVLLTWLYLSSYILLFGAELNSEVEHQTAKDSTTKGAPLGARGSWAADHVAGADDATPSSTPSPSLFPSGVHADHVAPARSSVKYGAVDYAAGRAGARIARAVGAGRIGPVGTLTATIGLALLRRQGRGGLGAALLATSAGVAWMTRRRPASSRVEAILFDLDGTLVDSNDLHVDAWDQAFREAGHDVDRDAIRGQIGKGGDLLVPALLPRLSKFHAKHLTTRHGAIFKSRYLDQVVAFPDAAALLCRVAANGQRVALASSASKAELDHYIALLGVADIVAATTSIDDVAKSKPAGDIFAAALRKLALPPEAVRVVGDTPYDIEAAAKCGIATVAVRSGGFDDARLEKAGAAALYDDVAALLQDFDSSPLVRK